MKIIVGVVFEYGRDYKKVETEIFNTVLMKKNMLETDYDVFIDDVIKSFMNKYSKISKQMKWRKSRFKFESRLCIKCEKVNEPSISSYIETLKRLKYIKFQEWIQKI